MSDTERFCHLHNHSVFSILDGFIGIDDFVRSCKEQKTRSIAITDHGSMFGAYRFSKAMRADHLNPIIGIEMYMASGDMMDKSTNSGKNHHQLLLAKTGDGVRNLYKMSTIGYTEGFYRRPRIDKKTLFEYSDGIITTSSCLAGLVPQAILKGELKDAEMLLLEFKECFGDDFYLEVQFNGVKDQEPVNQFMKKASLKYDIPLVCTSDAHYYGSDDAEPHELLLAMQTKTTINDEKRFKFETHELYLKTQEELEGLASDYPGAIESTYEIANKCNAHVETYDPIFIKPGGYTDQVLKNEIIRGLRRRLQSLTDDQKKVYNERFAEEFETITSLGFGPYFSVVSEYCRFAHDNGILMAPGRGSSAGSLISYALDITDVDPIKYGLSFSRFLNKNRVSPPDIDSDFQYDRREEVIEHLRNMYGTDRVAQISAFGVMQAKALIRNVGRALGYEYKEVNQFAIRIPDDNRGRAETIKTLTKNKEFMALLDENKEWERIFYFAKKIGHIVNTHSVNPSGVVISDKPLTYYMPLCYPPKGKVLTSQFDKNDVEEIGLIKYDILGLKTLTAIEKTIKLIKDIHGVELPTRIHAYDIDDQFVYKTLYNDKNLSGLFQIEGSDGFKNLIKQIHPSNIDDIADIVALWRPGPIDSGMVDQYIDARKSKEKCTYPVEGMDKVLDKTYGAFLYQEQIMRLAQVVAGYSEADADSLRRAIGKKKADDMAKHKRMFIDGCMDNNINSSIAEDLFSTVEKQADYLFNASHAVSYGLLTYWTMWLKAYYPVEFMASQLNVYIGESEKLKKYIRACIQMGIDVRPVDYSISDFYCTVENDNSIRIGIGAIKDSSESIITLRDRAINSGIDINNFNELYGYMVMYRRLMNKKHMECLCFSGAMDYLGIKRDQLFATYLLFDKNCGKKYKNKNFEFLKGMMHGAGILPKGYYEEIPQEELYKRYIHYVPYASLGYKLKDFQYIYSDKLKRINDFMSSDCIKGSIAGIIISVSVIKTKTGKKMCFVTIEDLDMSQASLTFFPQQYDKYQDILEVGRGIYIDGKKDDYKGDTKIIVNGCYSLKQLITLINRSN